MITQFCFGSTISSANTTTTIQSPYEQEHAAAYHRQTIRRALLDTFGSATGARCWSDIVYSGHDGSQAVGKRARVAVRASRRYTGSGAHRHLHFDGYGLDHHYNITPHISTIIERMPTSRSERLANTYRLGVSHDHGRILECWHEARHRAPRRGNYRYAYNPSRKPDASSINTHTLIIVTPFSPSRSMRFSTSPGLLLAYRSQKIY